VLTAVLFVAAVLYASAQSPESRAYAAEECAFLNVLKI
jgi:hypothetical protein